jgi:U4/U6 small nuclear ribonucleoprotein PRP3
MSLSRREIDDLKPEIKRIVEKVLGFDESALATAALNCLDKGYDRNKAERKLGSIIEGHQLTKFCSKLYSMYEDYRYQTKHERSSRKRKVGVSLNSYA